MTRITILMSIAAAAAVLSMACGDDDDDGGAIDAAPATADAAAGADAPPPDGPTATPMTLVAADRNGDIYTVDTATGAETMIIDTFPEGQAGVEVGVVSAMVYEPSTEAWWLGTGGNAPCGGCILVLDPDTGAATTLNTNDGTVEGTEQMGAVAGLAVDPVSGLIASSLADGGGERYQFDAATGAATLLPQTGSDGSSGKGIVFTDDGAMYVVGNDTLSSTASGSQEIVEVDTLTFTGFPTFAETSQSIASMAIAPDGTVYGILKDGGGINSVSATYLVTVNLGTAEITHVGANSGHLDGLAFVPTAMIP